MVTIKLKFPVNSDGAAIKELKMRRAKVRDMLAVEDFSGSDAAKECQLFANLCEVTPSVIEEMDLADYQEIQKAYQGFLS